ncbi:MAG: TIGR01777 family oxidoreductase [Bacteroidota bacterium]
MRVLITGGTGLLGTALAENLSDKHEIIIVSRNTQGGKTRFKMIPYDLIPENINNDTAIINLAGDNIGEGKWTPEKKRKIIDSRLKTGKKIIDAIAESEDKPQVLIQASAVGYYGRSLEKTFKEESDPASQSDFLADVCEQWEESTANVSKYGVRRVVIRTGVVLSKKGGALKELMLPFKMFAGGHIGSGKQWMSWIHIEDTIRAIRFLMENDHARGAFNLVAPNPVRNHEFARALAEAMNRPAILPVPAFAVRMMLGEKADYIVLEGQKVTPDRLETIGFSFKHPIIEGALANLVNGKS